MANKIVGAIFVIVGVLVVLFGLGAEVVGLGGQNGIGWSQFLVAGIGVVAIIAGWFTL